MGLKINGIPVAGLGLPGKKGADGRSAYQIAQDGGYKGSEAGFAELLATAASQSYVGQKIGEHNQDESAHSDIRELIKQSAGYSKEETLKGETKSLYGLGADAVPDDALALLSRFHKGLGNEYVWEKTKANPEYGFAKKTTYTGVSVNNNFYLRGKLYYASSYVFSDDGTSVTLVNPDYIEITDANYANVSIYQPILGKYVLSFSQSGIITYNSVYYIPPDATISTSGYMPISTCDWYSEPYKKTTITSYGYVNSPDPNAYPPAVSDGYTYTPLGQLGNKVQIATGSYTGTNKYGYSNPNKLTLGFSPKFVAVYMSGEFKLDDVSTMIWMQGATKTRYDNSNYDRIITVEENEFSWYNTSNASNQLNYSNTVYNYLAIG